MKKNVETWKQQHFEEVLFEKKRSKRKDWDFKRIYNTQKRKKAKKIHTSGYE